MAECAEAGKDIQKESDGGIAKGNLLWVLQANLAFLSHAERKIAEVLLQDPERFIACSLREMAALTGVSQGSIVNFAGKYAGGGFPRLKLRVAACLGELRVSRLT